MWKERKKEKGGEESKVRADKIFRDILVVGSY